MLFVELVFICMFVLRQDFASYSDWPHSWPRDQPLSVGGTCSKCHHIQLNCVLCVSSRVPPPFVSGFKSIQVDSKKEAAEMGMVGQACTSNTLETRGRRVHRFRRSQLHRQDPVSDRQKAGRARSEVLTSALVPPHPQSHISL